MAMATKVTPEQITEQRDAFVERLLQATSGVFEIFTMYLGGRLGLYQALAERGPMTADELAAATGIYGRYAREWLEQQAVAGIIDVQGLHLAASDRRFALSPAHAEVLVERDSLNYLAPLVQLAVGATSPVRTLVDAFRTGDGIAYSDFSPDLIEGQAGMNRAMFLQQLGSEWLPAIPDVHARLQASPPARIADLGCGAGWSSIGMAQSYPQVKVDGYDLDQPSIELALANAAEAGLGERVSFQVRDAGDPTLAGQYDLVTAFECIHDMADPVSALRTMLQLAGEHGTVIVADERVGEDFMTGGNEVEWMMYGWSVLHCLPVGMADRPSKETGTVMRPGLLRRYALEAGFRAVEILPIDNYFFRIYRLHG